MDNDELVARLADVALLYGATSAIQAIRSLRKVPIGARPGRGARSAGREPTRDLEELLAR